MSGSIPANDATGWGDSFRNYLLTSHDADGNTLDAVSAFNALAYGVVGDGTTDDTTAAQNWLDAALAAEGLAYMPPGLTVSVTGLSITLAGARLAIDGSGSTIKNSSTGTGSTAKCGLFVDGSRPAQSWIGIRNLCFQGSNVGGGGLYLSNCHTASLDNVCAHGFTSPSWDAGIHLDQVLAASIVNPNCYSNGVGMQMTDSGGGASNANTVFGGWLNDNSRYGALLSGGVVRGNKFYNTIFESNTTAGLYADGSTVEGCGVHGCWFESNGTQLKINAPGFIADGAVFANEGASGSIVVNSNGDNVAIRNPSFLTSSTMTVDSGATNVSLWDANGPVSVTDNSGGQFKRISSYLLTGGS